MKKHTLPHESVDVIIPVSIAFLLIIGIFISIVQIQQPQQKKSNAQTALQNCAVAESELSLGTSEKELFDIINNYRKEQGLQPLNYDSTLQRAAQWLSEDMAKSKNLDHTDSLGRDVGTRLKNCGLQGRSWGENIAQGYRTAQRTFDGWKSSPGHNKNMLGNYTHMGVAEKDLYWSLDLATINNGNTQPPPVSGAPIGQPSSQPSQQQPTLTQKPSPTGVSPLPTVSGSSPDLVAEDMIIAPNINDPCGPLGVYVTVKNIGTKAVTGAITVKANNEIGTIATGLLPGANTVLWIRSIVTSGENIAIVDPNNQIAEKNESNNQLKLFLPVPTKPAACPAPTSAPILTVTSAPGVPGGGNNPTPFPGFIVNPNDTQVLVSVKFPGIGINGNKSPRHFTRKITVTVFNLENEIAFSGQGFLTFDKNDLFRGIIHLGNVPNDTYYIKVVGDHTLQELVMPQFQPLSNDRLNVLSPVVLITGELTADNQLTIADYNMALTCFQDKKCGSKPAQDSNEDGTVDVFDSIDFNDDSQVNAIDYNFFLHNFKEFRGD